MSKSANELTRPISRKDFISALGIGAIGALASASIPSIALADPEIHSASPHSTVNPTGFQIVSEEEIDRMWEEALENASATNGEVVLNQPHPDSPPVAPCSSVSATVQANITVGGVPDVVYLLAVYENSGGRISKVYSKYAYGFHSTCEYGTYSHVIADGGRTLIVNATVTLRNTVGFAQSFKLHGEYGPNGGNYLSAAYI